MNYNHKIVLIQKGKQWLEQVGSEQAWNLRWLEEEIIIIILSWRLVETEF